MAVQIIHNDFLPDWGKGRFDLRARGDDTFDAIFGGTSSFDFARADLMPLELYNGDTLPNLRTGGGVATATNVENGDGSAKLTNIPGDGGLKFGGSGGVYTIDLPNDFDLLNMGAEASAVVWVWLNLPATLDSGFFGVAGYGKFNDGLNAQWAINTNGANFVVQIGGGGAGWLSTTWAQTAGEHLISVNIQRHSATLWSASVYDNAALVGTLSGAYPLHDPLAGDATQTPHMGYIAGGSGAADCIIRRTGVRQINPETYGKSEHEAWIAEQIAANGPRWP